MHIIQIAWTQVLSMYEVLTVQRELYRCKIKKIFFKKMNKNKTISFLGFRELDELMVRDVLLKTILIKNNNRTSLKQKRKCSSSIIR